MREKKRGFFFFFWFTSSGSFWGCSEIGIFLGGILLETLDGSRMERVSCCCLAVVHSRNGPYGTILVSSDRASMFWTDPLKKKFWNKGRFYSNQQKITSFYPVSKQIPLKITFINFQKKNPQNIMNFYNCEIWCLNFIIVFYYYLIFIYNSNLHLYLCIKVIPREHLTCLKRLI